MSSVLFSVLAAPKGAGKGAGNDDKWVQELAPGWRHLHQGAGKDGRLMGVVETVSGMGQDFPAWKTDERGVIRDFYLLWMASRDG